MRNHTFRVIGMGDIVTDLVVSIEKFPVEPTIHQRIEKLDVQPGGMGNFMIAGTRIGMEMIPLDVMGSDQYSAATLAAFAAEGIDTSRIELLENCSSKVILVLANPDGQHVFLFYLGGKYPQQTLKETWKKALAQSDALLAVGYTLSEAHMQGVTLEAMAYLKRQGGPVFFDPGPMAMSIPEDEFNQALQSSDVLLLTEDELKSIAGDTRPQDARQLLVMGPRLICIKRGALGCQLVNEKQTLTCPGYVVKVRDTNGAGDSFSAAFIYGYLNRWSLEEIGNFANAMGAAKVQKLGAGRNVPTLEEIKEVLSSGVRITLPGDVR